MAFAACAMVASSSATSCARRASDSRSTPRRLRSSLISCFVSRMPRASPGPAPDPCGGMLRLFDDDVLEKPAEAGFDGALVAVIDFQVVGNRALLAHGSICLNQHRAGRVAVSGARGFELLGRAQPRLDAGELL